jgi:hypothetical protein
MEMKKAKKDDSGSSLWPLTIWPEVEAAAEAVGKEVDPVSKLVEKYQRPLQVHLLGRFQHFPRILNNSDDLLQDFTFAKILKEGWLKKALSKEFRFREFLRKSLERFVWSWWRKQPEYRAWRERKRLEANPDLADADVNPGGGRTIPLTDDQPAPASDAESFNVEWAEALCQDARNRMEQDCNDPQKDQPQRRHIWEIFQLRILSPILDGAKPMPYADLVKRFQLRSVTEATNMLLTAKRMFIRHLHAVIGEYEKGPKAVAEELEEIKRVIARLSRKRRK